jgi:hypothetical protein
MKSWVKASTRYCRVWIWGRDMAGVPYEEVTTKTRRY